MMTVARLWEKAWLGGVLMLASPLVTASTTVTVKVTVVAPPPCVVNGDRPIEVEFGDVMTTRVDGHHYRTPVNYTLLCSGGSPNAIKLQVKGNTASFDRAVLQTNKAGLGIQLQRGDSKLGVGQWVNFTYPNKPDLWAVPVKQGTATLTGGEFFTSGATLNVAYQ